MENASEQDSQAITLNDLLKSKSVVLQRTTGLRPVITFFLQPYPSGTYAPDPDSEYCEERRLNLTAEGTPLHLSRSPSYPTFVHHSRTHHSGRMDQGREVERLNICSGETG